jgi:hypothetical protein
MGRVSINAEQKMRKKTNLWIKLENGVARAVETADVNVVVYSGDEKSNGRKD